MKCKHCNGTGKVRGYFYGKTGVNKWEKVWGDSPCDECNGTGEIQQTEQEYIQTCDTEQLTDIFMRFMFDAEFKARFVNGNFINEFREWLKQPHNKGGES